ncbi:MAG TPA: crossover junction endodeoxyribonuclease RuvC [Trueperaceae bacterium]|nr:crossover junction endodeoxyribonuclease RuvC [Trueperaceae bacterium]
MPKKDNLVVLGIDPGLANLGLGVVKQEARAFSHLDSQLVRTYPKTKQSIRLKKLYDACKLLIIKYQPDAMAIEGQFFQGQRGVSFKVGQAVGVCLLAAAEHNIEAFEYSPRQVKQTLVGTGRADKAQVSYMVRAMLSLKQTPESHHVADALALAITHISSYRLLNLESRT